MHHIRHFPSGVGGIETPADAAGVHRAADMASGEEICITGWSRRPADGDGLLAGKS